MTSSQIPIRAIRQKSQQSTGWKVMPKVQVALTVLCCEHERIQERWECFRERNEKRGYKPGRRPIRYSPGNRGTTEGR